MKIYLYQQSFDISESNICEGRGKYLVLSCTKNADKFIKAECEKCRSIPEMTQRIPKIIGALILKTVQHMLFVLNQEGVSTNAQKYLADVFNEKESVLQRVCAELISRWQNSDRIGTFLLADASRELTDAALQDLESLWLGYFIAHGYSPRDEFYTHNKLKNALSELALLSVNKNSGSSHNKIGVQALQDAPYEHLIYKMVEEQIGHDKNLNFYKSIFANPFKPGTYKDMLSPQELARLKEQVIENIHAMFRLPQLKFHHYVYYAGTNEPKTVKKIQAANFFYASLEKNEIPLLCLDSTLTGDAEHGMLISTKGIYISNLFEQPTFVHFNDVHSITYNSKYIFINRQKLNTGGLSGNDIKRLSTVIATICDLITPLYATERVSCLN